MLTTRLKQLRTYDRRSQAEIARFLHISREAYSMYETGKRKPGFETLLLLADLYHINLDYLLGRTDTSTPIPILSQEETALIDLYRTAGDNERIVINRMLLKAKKMPGNVDH